MSKSHSLTLGSQLHESYSKGISGKDGEYQVVYAIWKKISESSFRNIGA